MTDIETSAPGPNGSGALRNYDTWSGFGQGITGDKEQTGLTPASAIEPRLVHWLWDRRFPRGAVTLLGGLGGVGKSQLLIDCAARHTRGELVEDDLAASVLLISAEDTAAEVVAPRLIAAGADQERVFLLELGSDLDFPRDLDNGRFEQMVVDAGATLVIIDPLTAFIDGAKTDTYKVSDVRRMLKGMTAVAERHGVAVVCVLHFKKGEVSALIHQFSGSAGFGDACRSAFVVAKDPSWEGPDEDAPMVFLHAKSNWGRMTPPRRFHIEPFAFDHRGLSIETSHIAWDEEDSSITADSVFGKKQEISEERSKAQEVLRSLLADGPVPMAEVRKDAEQGHGVSWATLRRAKDDLGVVAQVVRKEDGKTDYWTWRLPEPAE